MNHTPTPWHIGMKPGPAIYGPVGESIVLPHNVLLDEEENKANLLHIVHCVNSHGAMVEALHQIEARAVYMKVKDPTYAETHWEYIRQACLNALTEKGA